MFNLSQNVRSAVRALLANKLRSGLTMLGIIIGVAAVVALLAVGNGVQTSITSRIQGIGANLITVSGGVRNTVSVAGDNPAPLTYNDSLQLVGLPGVAAVAPQQRSQQRMTNQNKQTQVPILGVVPDYAIVHPDQLDHGRFITNDDMNNKSRVVVLGSQSASDLFGGLEPVGQSVKINGILFQVVGVMKSQGSGFGFSRDSTAYVPLMTFFARLGNTRFGVQRTVSSIEISAANADATNSVMDEVTQAMSVAHKIKPGAAVDFTVQSQADILATATGVAQTLTLFLGAIAAISLVVGGIGIMNIMLVSVTERTREIGLRKAVGARRRDILYQFLTETVTLSVLGGIFGILVGWGIAEIGNSSGGGITAVVSPQSVLLAFGFSAMIGIFFGIYPANRAAGLKPIEALRYE